MSFAFCVALKLRHPKQLNFWLEYKINKNKEIKTTRSLVQREERIQELEEHNIKNGQTDR